MYAVIVALRPRWSETDPPLSRTERSAKVRIRAACCERSGRPIHVEDEAERVRNRVRRHVA